MSNLDNENNLSSRVSQMKIKDQLPLTEVALDTENDLSSRVSQLRIQDPSLTKVASDNKNDLKLRILINGDLPLHERYEEALTRINQLIAMIQISDLFSLDSIEEIDTWSEKNGMQIKSPWYNIKYIEKVDESIFNKAISFDTTNESNYEIILTINGHLTFDERNAEALERINTAHNMIDRKEDKDDIYQYFLSHDIHIENSLWYIEPDAKNSKHTEITL